MADWDDLVLAGQPRLVNYEFETTTGVDWEFVVGPFGPRDGEPVDLSEGEFECKVLLNGQVVAEWDVTGDAEGFLTGTIDDADTPSAGGQGFWYCVGEKDGKRVQFWGPGVESPFLINQGV